MFRLLQHKIGGTFTPIGKTLPSVDTLIRQIENETTQPDSVRFHIPRTLRVLYDIRNKRDAAHLADGIDANLQDATLIVAAMDWVLAELVRLYHGVSPNEAQGTITALVKRDVPAVDVIGGQPVILSGLKPRESTLLLIYRAGETGCSLDELAGWLRLSRRDHLRDRVKKLDQEKRVYIHPKDQRIYVTSAGIREVETRGLALPK